MGSYTASALWPVSPKNTGHRRREGDAAEAAVFDDCISRRARRRELSVVSPVIGRWHAALPASWLFSLCSGKNIIRDSTPVAQGIADILIASLKDRYGRSEARMVESREGNARVGCFWLFASPLRGRSTSCGFATLLFSLFRSCPRRCARLVVLCVRAIGCGHIAVNGCAVGCGSNGREWVYVA